tara:strand:+ start:150 stop:1049 length:900 start_codon:yes stop_codon:yes gene_type:complete
MDLIYIIGYDNIDIFQPNNYKIGKSTEKSLKNRLSQIQTGSPKPCKVHATYLVKDPQLEKVCHAHLNDHRIFNIKRQHGEWFFGKLNKIKNVIQEVIKDQEVKEENKDNENYLKLEKEFKEKKIKAEKDAKDYLHNFDLLKETANKILKQHDNLILQKKELYELIKELHIYDKNKYCYNDASINTTNKNTIMVEWISLILRMCDEREVDLVNHQLKNISNELKSLDRYKRIDIACLSKYQRNEVFKYYPETKKITWDRPAQRWGYGQEDEIVGNATKVYTDYNHETHSFNYTLHIDEKF